MQLTAEPRTTEPRTTEPGTTEPGAAEPQAQAGTAGRRDADGMAVASFVLGLVGLLVMNVFLGPVSIVLASVALRRGTERRGRALLGLGLGIADLVVLGALIAADGTMSWSITG
ncbi:hypothetical protein ACFYWS_32950 [Streptomyces sp. NPDC002795]|uniref:hypothetical protein n=1 Tax=Streptomyces sp. NPDC002795 TaxID=3364665 RepID=UPI00368225E6